MYLHVQSFLIHCESEVITLVKHWEKIAVKCKMAFNSCWREAGSEEVWEIKEPCFLSFVCHWLIVWLGTNCLCAWLISASVSLFIKVQGVISINLGGIHLRAFMPESRMIELYAVCNASCLYSKAQYYFMSCVLLQSTEIQIYSHIPGKWEIKPCCLGITDH